MMRFELLNICHGFLCIFRKQQKTRKVVEAPVITATPSVADSDVASGHHVADYGGYLDADLAEYSLAGLPTDLGGIELSEALSMMTSPATPSESRRKGLTRRRSDASASSGRRSLSDDASNDCRLFLPEGEWTLDFTSG